MNKNNYIIAGIVIVIVLAIAIFGSKKAVAPSNIVDTATPATETATSGTTKPATSGAVTNKSKSVMIKPSATVAAIVTLTSTGFIPETVTIKNGEAIKFVNQSNTGMWVASNPHPFHTDYEAFDEGMTVGKGGSYTFTFTQAGAWWYHNHNNPKISGTVIVK